MEMFKWHLLPELLSFGGKRWEEEGKARERKRMAQS